MKRILAFVMLAMMLVAFNACDNAKSKLEDETQAANKECPLTVQQGMIMQSVKYADDKVTVTFLLNAADYDIGIIRSGIDDVVYQIPTFDNDAVQKLLSLCKEAKADLVIDFQSSDGTNASGTLTWQYM